jgi:hypothetical protein
MAAQTRNTTFLLPRPQLVDGSFFTQAAWTLRDRKGSVYTVHTDSNEASFTVESEQSNISKTVRGMWKEWKGDGLKVLYKQSTIVVRGNGWEVNCTRKPIYNHVAGSSRWRFDLSIRPLDGSTGLEAAYGKASSSCFPHGILGQSWDGDNIAVHGKTDSYVYNSSKPVVRTTAHAEGAIEGTSGMYELPSPHTTQFAFSRFHKKAADVCAPRDVSKLAGRKETKNGLVAAGSTEPNAPRNIVTYRRKR